MSWKSSMLFRMNVTLALYDRDGNLKDVRHEKNMVVTTGLTHIADQLGASPSEGAMSAMAVGSGTAATSAATSTLQTSLGSVALDSRTHTGAVVTYVATFPAGTGTGALTEAGIFNVAAIMLCRLVYDVINKGASDSLVITWTLTAADDGVGV